MSKLVGLKEGEYVGINIWPVVPGATKLSINRQKELLVNEYRDGIGRGICVQKDGGKYFVAVLMDIDFDSDPSNKRYIFTYFNTETQQDETVDTLYDEGWKCFEIDVLND